MLDQNDTYIKAVMECQKEGRHDDASTYLSKLQGNLMYLAAIADAQSVGSRIGWMDAGESWREHMEAACSCRRHRQRGWQRRRRPSSSRLLRRLRQQQRSNSRQQPRQLNSHSSRLVPYQEQERGLLPTPPAARATGTSNVDRNFSKPPSLAPVPPTRARSLHMWL